MCVRQPFLNNISFDINSKAGINQYDTYKGHAGAITGLNFHPLSGPVDFSDLYLTSSVDWTVKLWRAKVHYYVPWSFIRIFY